VGPEPQRRIDGPEGGQGLARLVAVVADQLADDRPVLLLDAGLVVLPVGAAAGEREPLGGAPAQQQGVQDSLPLSESMPSSGKGSRSRICFSASTTAAWPLPQIASHSVQPVATSVATRVFK